MARIAVLCGTGMGAFRRNISEIEGTSSYRISIESEWGDVPVTILSNSNGEIMIIDRHHSTDGSRTPPHSIEHRANVHAVVSFNPDLVVSINSVGSMVEFMPPGIVGIASDVLDLSIRPWTFHDENAIHADRTSPFDSGAMEICSGVLEKMQGSSPAEVIVAQCIGPQFESPSEINALQKLGAHVVGMTLGPESRLVAEISLPHIAIPCSSNWAAGKNPENPEAPIDHLSVESMASQMHDLLSSCISALLSELGG